MLRRLLTFLGYLGLTLLVIGVTFALVAYGKDYVYDFSTRSIIQNGHVIISSVPSGIRVKADGYELKKKTPYQEAYKVGEHTFELVKDGFWPWQKAMKVVAGQVTLARYVILVPKEPQITTLDSRSQVLAQSISKDHRHLAYVTAGSDPGVYTVDLSNNNAKPTKLYAPKPAAPPAGVEVLSEVVWSDDASHLLIVSAIDGQPVHRLVAGGGGETIDLTDRYKFNFSGLKFSASTWKQLYWISPEGLRRLDVDAQSVSPVLAERVTQFWVIPDRVLYVQQTELGRSLWSLDGKGRHQEIIQALPESDSYSVSYAGFRGEDYLAVVPSKTQVGTLYIGAFGDTPVAKVVARGVDKAQFSPDGRFAAFSSPTAIVTYDVERSGLTGDSVVYTASGRPGRLSNMTWFDNYHVLATRDNRLYWSEYDGSNEIDLGPVVGGFSAYNTSDAKSVVLFRQVGQVVRLMELLVKP